MSDTDQGLDGAMSGIFVNAGCGVLLFVVGGLCGVLFGWLMWG